jgi:hypothetical protein
VDDDAAECLIRAEVATIVGCRLRCSWQEPKLSLLRTGRESTTFDVGTRCQPPGPFTVSSMRVTVPVVAPQLTKASKPDPAMTADENALPIVGPAVPPLELTANCNTDGPMICL